MSSARAAITGVGAVTCLGVGAGVLFERWAAGECGIDGGLGRCRSFVPTHHLSRKEVRRADRFTQFALVAADEAVAAAGWNSQPPAVPDRIGCVIGTGIGGIGMIEQQHDVFRGRTPGCISPLGIPLMMANAASGVVAMRHGIKGQCYGTVSACAAGAHAIGTGLRMIQSGDADACLVGGSEAAITPLAIACFNEMHALSVSGISRPFDARRDGFVMGEGAGVMLLEREELARERGAPIVAWLTGYGATADAHHLTAPEPTGEGAARAIALALRDAGIAVGEVDYINAHGTGTPLNDRAETTAIKTALAERATRIPVTSTKSVIGHLIGAAGAVEALATALSLQHGLAPPTVGFEQRDEGLDLDYAGDGVRVLERNGRPLNALSNSFGFGGHNVVLCMQSEVGETIAPLTKDLGQ